MVGDHTTAPGSAAQPWSFNGAPTRGRGSRDSRGASSLRGLLLQRSPDSWSGITPIVLGREVVDIASTEPRLVVGDHCAPGSRYAERILASTEPRLVVGDHANAARCPACVVPLQRSPDSWSGITCAPAAARRRCDASTEPRLVVGDHSASMRRGAPTARFNGAPTRGRGSRLDFPACRAKRWHFNGAPTRGRGSPAPSPVASCVADASTEPRLVVGDHTRGAR